jgi:hypothetical protein
MISRPHLQNAELEWQLLQIQLIDLEKVIKQQQEEMVLLKLRLADLGSLKSEIELLNRINMTSGEVPESLPTMVGVGAPSALKGYLPDYSERQGDMAEKRMRTLQNELNYLLNEITEMRAAIKNKQILESRVSALQSELELASMERDNYRYELELLLKEHKQVLHSQAAE